MSGLLPLPLRTLPLSCPPLLMFFCFTSILPCTFFNHTIKKQKTKKKFCGPLLYSVIYKRTISSRRMQGHQGRGRQGRSKRKKLCQNSKRSMWRSEIVWKIVKVGVGEGCQRVIPVGQCWGPCLDMKVEIVGHSGSALHPNAKWHRWEADEGRFVGARLDENRSWLLFDRAHGAWTAGRNSVRSWELCILLLGWNVCQVIFMCRFCPQGPIEWWLKISLERVAFWFWSKNTMDLIYIYLYGVNPKASPTFKSKKLRSPNKIQMFKTRAERYVAFAIILRYDKTRFSNCNNCDVARNLVTWLASDTNSKKEVWNNLMPGYRPKSGIWCDRSKPTETLIAKQNSTLVVWEYFWL